MYDWPTCTVGSDCGTEIATHTRSLQDMVIAHAAMSGNGTTTTTTAKTELAEFIVAAYDWLAIKGVDSRLDVQMIDEWEEWKALKVSPGGSPFNRMQGAMGRSLSTRPHLYISLPPAPPLHPRLPFSLTVSSPLLPCILTSSLLGPFCWPSPFYDRVVHYQLPAMHTTT